MMTNKQCIACGFTVVALGSVLVIFNLPSTSAAPPAANQASLTEQVNTALGLAASEVFDIVPEPLDDGGIAFEVSIHGRQREVRLWPYSNRHAGYQLLVQQADGSLLSIDPGPVRTMRGNTNDPDSAVAASLTDGQIEAQIFIGDRKYVIESLAKRMPGVSARKHVLYDPADVLNDHAYGDDALEAGFRQIASGGNSNCGNGENCVAELAIDADYEYYLDWGSVAAVEARVNNVINTVNVQYERDVNITHVITAVIVRTAEPDPYTSTDAETLLNQFRNQWINNHGNIQRDIAQLFTGKELNSSIIGIAWLNAVCGTAGYSVVQSDFNGVFSCASDLSAHELGHNWGADHCTCTSNTMNPYITCSNIFHQTFTIPDIIAFRDSRSCLEPEGGTGCTSDGECDDADACNGGETCDISSGTCLGGTPLNCDDADACTDDTCDPVGGCNNTMISCDDGNECTFDSCDPAIGCQNDPTPGSCCGNGECESGEDCNACSDDCISGDGNPFCGDGTCGDGEDCLNCAQDCNGRQNGRPSNRFCCHGGASGGGENPVGCGDLRCTQGDFQCGGGDNQPYCCGDGSCEGAEDTNSCLVDCACSSDADCADGDNCTQDLCNADGTCQNPPVGCVDGDGCCPPGCSQGADNDCSCGQRDDPCSSNGDCCSNKCRGNGYCL